MSTIIDLRNKRANLWEQTKSFLEEHRGADGLVTADAVETYEKMVADVQALGTEIERMEQQMAMDAALSKPTSEPVRAEFKPAGNVKPTATEAYNKAFWSMMRGDTSMAVRDTLSVAGGTPEGSAGGFTVPDEFERQLVQALDENNVFRSIARVISTNSGNRMIPVATDTGTATWVDEGGTITDSDPTFSQKSLGAFKLATMVKVTNELLNDSAFDIASYIAERFGIRFGNAEENAFLNGTGVSSTPGTPSQPTGLLSSVTAGTDTTTANRSTLTFDDVYKLYYALKSPYRAKASFMCHETVMLNLMMLKDANGYIWKPGLEIGKPDTLLNHPIYTSAYMPAIAGTAADAGKKVILFGDFSYYWIADRQGRTVQRLNELYAVNGQVGFIGTQRVDGKLILDEAMKVTALGA